MNKETYLTEYPKHESMRENVKKDKNKIGRASCRERV